MTPEELKEIEERCNKATPNPTLTRYDHGGGRSYVSLPSGGVDLVADYYGEGPDREFYYHSREDIPKLLAHIKELESQITRWIPVEERLPEESGYYLCWDIIACESAIPYVAVCCFRKERGSFDSCSDLCITHWQPLPKGPEE